MLSNLPFTITDLHTAYRNGASPVEVIDEIFDRLAAVDDPAIFIHLRDRAELRAEAAELGPFDPARPLWGIPFAVKDNIDVAEIPTTAACPAYAYTPQADAFVVASLRAAGGMMIGKTNLDQFATGLVGIRTPYGVPRNSLDPALVPGGSSGGSGVIVGHGIVSFSLGTDTAGSGRVPAALNNIVGLKPSLGALSATGVVPACRTLDTVSIFALTVDDAYAVFDVAAGYDGDDAYSKAFTKKPLHAVPTGLRIGIPDARSIEFFGDAAQERAFRRDAAVLAGSGAQIVEVDFTPFHDVAHMLYEGAWVAERYTVIEELLTEKPDALHAVTRQIITQAENLSAADAFRGLYRLQHLKRRAEPVLADLDLLCVPTIPTFYSLADLESDPVTPNSNLGIYTNFVNLLDLCGIAVPTAPRSDGRPGSVTLLAGAGKDALTASVARSFEKECPRTMGATQHPVAEAGSIETHAETDTLQLAVCGAHMSGLALNWQLTDRGGQFLRTARTSEHYSFYALPGGPPERPGLVRTGAVRAQSVAVEIWSLPMDQVGGFLAGIPSPLGLGTVELMDGSTVKGFICEASGIAGARDISDIGDWRAYLAQAV